MVRLGRNISVLCLCSYWSYQGHAQALVDKNVSPSSLAWEAFWKVTLIAPQVAPEASKVLIVKTWTSVRGAIRSTPGASPPHLGGRTRKDKYVTCVSKGQIKFDQERKALV